MHVWRIRERGGPVGCDPRIGYCENEEKKSRGWGRVDVTKKMKFFSQ